MAEQHPKETKRISCNTCNGLTNHFLQSAHTASSRNSADGDPDDDEVFEVWTDSLWMCAGCCTATLEHESRIKIDGVAEGDQLPADVIYYPKRSSSSLRVKPFMKLSPQLQKLYREVVRCFNEDCLLLCTIGLRALIEGVCEDKKLRGKKLEEKIDGLNKFFASQNLIDYLHGFRFIGNDAAHELKALTSAEAGNAIRVMEDLLNFLYDFDYRASRIKNASKRAALKSAPRRNSIQ